MRVTVNGEDHETPDGSSVNDLLRQLGVAPDFVAVAVNREVVHHRDRETTALSEGDSVDVVRAAPGG